ncbi:M20 family metallopeptidase [Acetonema longum]|uniref:Putative peptidase n=1 Tax=Acetonema longum DSM 6540 TaxID=1009370 RepID=F7NKQ5_9FIRM|nr:M20 family metallopeptidase [Acetonema longum]EGO63359.1 putative peptidase [Acetonema longum DSM 6540]
MQKQAIFQYIDEHRGEMMALWQELVNRESGSADKAGVDKVQDRIKNILEAEGALVRMVEYEQAGNMLIAEIGGDRAKAPVLFSGHVDTVFKTGTVEKRPFTVRDGKAYGPGVLDMKGGVVAFLYAVKALRAAGFSERPIKMLLAGDEETGHLASNAAEVFVEEARGCAAAFNCETGFVDDAIVVGRKGVAGFTMEVRGVAAHVGNDPENGRSAIVEIAHKLLEVEKLTDWQEGTSFNVGVIEGGTVPNATPDYAKIRIDVRFVDENAIPKFTRQIEAIAAKTYVPGTTTTLTAGASFKPMTTTEGVKRLFRLVKETYAENGFGAPYEKAVGGGADSAYTVIAGVPTVCAMGVKGGRNHSPEEYAIVESLFERAKLLAACVLKLNSL